MENGPSLRNKIEGFFDRRTQKRARGNIFILLLLLLLLFIHRNKPFEK